MPVKLKGKGSRGSWFARVAGERLPCIYREWVVPPRRYLDPEAQPGVGKWDEFITALRETKRAILASGARGENGGLLRDENLQIFPYERIAPNAQYPQT